MKRSTICFALATLLLTAGFLTARPQTVGAPVEGKVTQEGKPLSDVQVVLTNVDTGKVYKTKTDKSGSFVLIGIPYGNFQVQVLGEKGEKLFTEKTAIGTGNDSSTNILKIDIPKGGAADNTLSAPDAPKLTKEQIAKIEADNKKIAGLNSLINEAQTARQAQEWPKAENALKQLIAAAPETTRWDLYQALGETQGRSNKWDEAAQTYGKGVQIAERVMSGAAPSDPKIPSLNPAAARTGAGRMLTSQGNAYLKLQKQDEAIASLRKAADLEPSSSMAHYNLCGVEFSAGKYDDAKPACNKYLQLEPGGARADEVKGFLAQMGQK